MKRALFVLVCLFGSAAWADAVSDLAHAAGPPVVDLARRMILAEWTERVNELLLNAPVAPSNGKWKPGDTHFDAASKWMMGEFTGWAKQLAESPKATQIVMQEFPKSLQAAHAIAASKKLAEPSMKDYGTFADRNQALVDFALSHPELQIGEPAFTSAFQKYSSAIGVTTIRETDEMIAFATSDEGRAYDHARSVATRHVKTYIDGALQLAFFDHQQEVLEAIKPHAQACARAHR